MHAAIAKVRLMRPCPANAPAVNQVKSSLIKVAKIKAKKIAATFPPSLIISSFIRKSKMPIF